MRIVFRLRSMMLIVAVVAGGLGWRQHCVLEKLRLEYETEASICETYEQFARTGSSLIDDDSMAERVQDPERSQLAPRMISGLVGIDSWEEPPELLRRKAEHWARLRVKWEQAARRPWLVVEPDPPEPDWSDLKRNETLPK